MNNHEDECYKWDGPGDENDFFGISDDWSSANQLYTLNLILLNV
jgi:hypothetical protein